MVGIDLRHDCIDVNGGTDCGLGSKDTKTVANMEMTNAVWAYERTCGDGQLSYGRGSRDRKIVDEGGASLYFRRPRAGQ